jgi:serine/threonine protein kinase
VRQLSSKLTDPRTLLGTVECMAPEQSRDPSAVGSQVDIDGLGATLFWLLTAEYPHPPSRSDHLRVPDVGLSRAEDPDR